MLFLLLAGICFYAGNVFAQMTRGIAGIASSITGMVGTLATMMIAISYIAGIGFVIASLFKFKQHKDNPTQIPLGTPLALLIIGIVLVFLPMIFTPVGESIFGTGAKPAGTIPTNIDSGVQTQ